MCGCDQIKFVATLFASALTDPLHLCSDWGGSTTPAEKHTDLITTNLWKTLGSQIFHHLSQLYYDISLEHGNFYQTTTIVLQQTAHCRAAPGGSFFPHRAHLLCILQSSWEEIGCWAFATDPLSNSPSRAVPGCDYISCAVSHQRRRMGG